MTTVDSTTATAETLHPTQTRDAAREAGRILQLPRPPIVAEEDRATVYLETGAGLVLAIATDGHFSIGDMTDARRPLISFTPEESRALYHFWWSIVAPGIVATLPAALAHVKAQRTPEETNENA